MIPQKNKYLSQFLPESLIYLTVEKSFNFHDKKLKSSYVIDLIHNLLFKYFYSKENSFNLSSIILKEKYGYQYNFYIKFLLDSKILIFVKNYQKGKSCRIYKFNDTILGDKFLRFKNKDTILLKKRKTQILNNLIENDTPINKELRKKLIDDLYSVDIDYDQSYNFIKSFETDTEIFQKNSYTIDSIKNGEIFYHFDNYGRFHTNFTILKSFLRKNYLTIDGESTVEIDIKNSQPLFLNKLIHNQDSELIFDDEINLYGQLTSSGMFYKYLQDNLIITDKSKIKNIVYKIFFGRSYSSESNNQFKKLFPKIYDFISKHKKVKKDYKSISYELQKLESDFIFNKVIKYLHSNHPNIKIITCHDSIICKKSDSHTVKDIFEYFLKLEFDFLSCSSLVFNI
jgi:hypothetical protein